MVEVRPALKDIMSYIKALQEYFSLKDKVLWTGSWSSGSITVPDTDKYSEFKVNVGARYVHAIRSGDQLHGTMSFRGSDGTVIYQNVFSANISGNSWTISGHGQMGHRMTSDHGSFGNTLIVTEIIGSEPIAPEYLGGGV